MRWFSSRPVRVIRVAAPHGAVPRSTATLIEQRGWKKTWGGAWVGPYATRYNGTWPGRIEVAGDVLKPYIQNPPPEMRRHHKWVCFHAADGDWYRVHLQITPKDRDPNSVIRYIEQILSESFRKP